MDGLFTEELIPISWLVVECQHLQQEDGECSSPFQGFSMLPLMDGEGHLLDFLLAPHRVSINSWENIVFHCLSYSDNTSTPTPPPPPPSSMEQDGVPTIQLRPRQDDSNNLMATERRRGGQQIRLSPAGPSEEDRYLRSGNVATSLLPSGSIRNHQATVYGGIPPPVSHFGQKNISNRARRVLN